MNYSLIFKNDRSKIIDAIFYFPISPNHVFTDFIVEYKNMIVKGKVKEKE